MSRSLPKLYVPSGDGAYDENEFSEAGEYSVIYALEYDADLHWAVLAHPAPLLLGPWIWCEHANEYERRNVHRTPGGWAFAVHEDDEKDEAKRWYAQVGVNDKAEVGRVATPQEALVLIDAKLLAQGYRLVGGAFKVGDKLPPRG